MADDLSQTVISLHEIARQIEREIGVGELSEDIRKCADRLNVLISPYSIKEKNLQIKKLINNIERVEKILQKQKKSQK